jgi:hypothetical protein
VQTCAAVASSSAKGTFFKDIIRGQMGIPFLYAWKTIQPHFTKGANEKISSFPFRALMANCKLSQICL